MRHLQESRIKIGKKNFFYLEGGYGSPVIFLHGTPTCSYLWRNILKDLIDDFSLYAPDLPGFAESESLNNCSVYNYSDWLYDFTNKVVPDKKVDLFLYNISGPIGLVFALQHPEKVRRLIIGNTVISRKELSNLMKFILSPQASHAYRNYFNKTAFRLFMRTAIRNKHLLSDRTLNKYHKVFKRDQEEQITERFISEFTKDTEDFILSGLSKLNRPVLVLWADKDNYIPFLNGKIMQSNIKNSIIELVPNCGHLFPEEAPGYVAERVRNFLGDVV